MRRPLTTACLAAALALSGCGDGGDPAGPRGAEAVGGGAAELRAQLTAGLAARQWLNVLAARTALIVGEDTPSATAAAAALAATTSSLERPLARVAGAQRAGAAVAALRRSDSRFGELARARAADNAVATAGAGTALAGLEDDLVVALAAPDTDDPLTRLLQAVRPTTRALRTALQALAEGSPTTPGRTRTASARTAGLARVLASIATRKDPEGVPGGADAPAAELLAVLTTELVDHAYGQSAAIGAALASRPTGPAARAAGRVLEENTDALAGTVASVYGENPGERFGMLWNGHVAAFGQYAQAKADEDDAAAQRALAALRRFRSDAAALLAELDPDRRGARTVRALGPHVTTTTAAIRAQVVASPKHPARLREAADAAQAVARALAQDIAEQFPEKFPAR